MADKTPEELLAEVQRLTTANATLTSQHGEVSRQLQSAKDRLNNRALDVPPDALRLKSENLELRRELAETKGAVAAEKGPAAGTKVCYQRGGEPFCRPAEVLSDGFSERVPLPGGSFQLHCHLAVAEHPGLSQAGHTFEVDRAYHPLGAPDTWHTVNECPYAGDAKKCPYAVAGVTPKSATTEAP
jgi:hypothetical protein